MILTLFTALWLVGCLWFMVCTLRTSKQLKELINLTEEMEPQEALYLLHGIEKVSFGAHVRALLFFRDPMLLYSAGLRALYCRTKVSA